MLAANNIVQGDQRFEMEKALRGWLEAHSLPTIVAAVMGIIVALALLLVLGGYWWVQP